MLTSGFERERASLSARRLVRGDGFVVDDVHCCAGRGGWSAVEEGRGYALVLTRSGCFARRANGIETVIDAGLAYFRAVGEEQQIAHPFDCGDRCTSIGLDPSFLASVWGSDQSGLPGAIFSTPDLDLAHRRILASCRLGPSGGDVEELVYAIAAAALTQHDRQRVDSGRPAGVANRRRIVNEARQLLVDDPRRTLAEVARELAVSPHHLSRVFSKATGVPFTGYRNRLRVREALERIADGERSLTRVAAELGFSDHAHLTRTIRSQTGSTPSAHRRMWNATVPG